MSNSMFISLWRIPLDINEVDSLIKSVFMEFRLAAPRVWHENRNSQPSILSGGFIMIDGADEGDHCWVSINNCASELTGDDKCTVLADVKTRGSWIFAGIVAYAFCKSAGATIFNDAGELDGQETYTAESLKRVIKRLIDQ